MEISFGGGLGGLPACLSAPSVCLQRFVVWGGAVRIPASGPNKESSRFSSLSLSDTYRRKNIIFVDTNNPQIRREEERVTMCLNGWLSTAQILVRHFVHLPSRARSIRRRSLALSAKNTLAAKTFSRIATTKRRVLVPRERREIAYLRSTICRDGAPSTASLYDQSFLESRSRGQKGLSTPCSFPSPMFVVYPSSRFTPLTLRALP